MCPWCVINVINLVFLNENNSHYLYSFHIKCSLQCLTPCSVFSCGRQRNAIIKIYLSIRGLVQESWQSARWMLPGDWLVTQLFSDRHLMVCLGGCSKGAVYWCYHNGRRWINKVSGNIMSYNDGQYTVVFVQIQVLKAIRCTLIKDSDIFIVFVNVELYI